MFECRTFISVKEICQVLSVSESKSYAIVRDLNKELSDKAYMVIPGRVSRKYFEERFYGVDSFEKEDEDGINIKGITNQFETNTGRSFEKDWY